MRDRIAYKIMSSTELEQMRRDGLFRGSPAEVADGYIHLSCGSQLTATLDKDFSGVNGLVLAAVDLMRLGVCAGSPRAVDTFFHTSMEY
jgi:uncharacterized protein (DUF952 family)